VEDHALVVYGTSWCPDVARSRAPLDRKAIPYVYIDVEEDAVANEYCAALNGGVRKVPTLIFGSGLVLIEPSDEVLNWALSTEGLA
jgi:glutaredoxin